VIPIHYQPYYCEENIRHLIDHPELAGRETSVVFITNPQKMCAVYGMKLAEPGEAVLWDYHCILASRDGVPLIWDLDTRLGLPHPARDYLTRSFDLAGPVVTQPRFRIVAASDYRRDFASNRAHMRHPAGGWLHQPPPWPCFGENRAANLHRFIDLDDRFIGTITDLDGLSDHLGI